MSYITGSIDVNVALSFLSGIIFLATMLVFSVYFPNPSPLQIRVFITALALAAAGVGAVFPGLIEVEFKPLVRAGGAIALFLVVYLLKPAIEKAVPDFKEPSSPPEPIAEKYLSYIDADDMRAAWDFMDPVARERLVPQFDRMEQIYRATRKPLGAVEHRTLIGTEVLLNPPGQPVGLYRLLAFRTKFSNEATTCRREVVGLRATQDMHWRVFTHHIEQTPIPCI